MKVTIHLFGTLRRFSEPSTPGIRGIEVPAGSNVSDVIRMLNTKEKEVAATAINGKVCSLENKLREGDQIFLVAALGGG